jgi:hypothetical protein
MFKTTPQLLTDYNVAPCGDGICEEGETCACAVDCGACPPPGTYKSFNFSFLKLLNKLVRSSELKLT